MCAVCVCVCVCARLPIILSLVSIWPIGEAVDFLNFEPFALTWNILGVVCLCVWVYVICYYVWMSVSVGECVWACVMCVWMCVNVCEEYVIHTRVYVRGVMLNGLWSGMDVSMGQKWYLHLQFPPPLSLYIHTCNVVHNMTCLFYVSSPLSLWI